MHYVSCQVYLGNVFYGTSTEVCASSQLGLVRDQPALKLSFREMEGSAYVVSQEEGFFLGCFLGSLVADKAAVMWFGKDR